MNRTYLPFWPWQVKFLFIRLLAIGLLLAACMEFAFNESTQITAINISRVLLSGIGFSCIMWLFAWGVNRAARYVELGY